jgi:hypothetical protein
MLLQTTIIPVPILVHTGPSGSWTESDTQVAIVLLLTFAFACVLVNLSNWIYCRAKGETLRFIDLLDVMNGKYGVWAITETINIFFYSVLGIYIMGGLGYLIYNLIY